MKKIILFLVAFNFQTVLFAQGVKQYHENARSYMHKGDYPNAILILNRGLAQYPDDLELAKDLGLNYYYSGDYKKSVDVLSKLFGRKDVDDQCFQIAGDAYWAMDEARAAEDIYRRGILKLPNSGPLYNELGKVLWVKNDYSAIKQWEMGIEKDPGFAANYYNASKYYYLTFDKVWTLIYGEIYINIDPRNANAIEIKGLLAEGYKKLFLEADLEKNNKDKNGFVAAYLNTMNKQTSLASMGINIESLSKIRTRFIADWEKSYAGKFPFRLFQLHKQYIEEGLFDAYNQWVFASEPNMPSYKKWIETHSKEYNDLKRFLESRIFKLPKGQYYH